jgi:hypothetical protein
VDTLVTSFGSSSSGCRESSCKRPNADIEDLLEFNAKKPACVRLSCTFDAPCRPRVRLQSPIFRRATPNQLQSFAFSVPLDSLSTDARGAISPSREMKGRGTGLEKQDYKRRVPRFSSTERSCSTSWTAGDQNSEPNRIDRLSPA